jgi:hypothetical protein
MVQWLRLPTANPEVPPGKEPKSAGLMPSLFGHGSFGRGLFGRGS